MRGLSASRVENVLAKLPVAFSDCEAAQSKSAERRLRVMKRRIGGAKGGRTPDLLNAIQALSQLSYGPTGGPGVAARVTRDIGKRDRGRKGKMGHAMMTAKAYNLPKCKRARKFHARSITV